LQDRLCEQAEGGEVHFGGNCGAGGGGGGE
jgi:hypothetical protein